MKNPFHKSLTALVAGLLFLYATSSMAGVVAAGDTAPVLNGINQEGKAWKWTKHSKAKTLILYFYPKDDTKGCTKEACGLRDRMGDLQSHAVEVVGVSFDSPESHRAFIEKYHLNFTLLADTEGKIADAYGVRMTGKNMARRVSFLIGRDGKVIHVTDSPDSDVHLKEMQEQVAQLPTK